jgi:hypothetical protein
MFWRTVGGMCKLMKFTYKIEQVTTLKPDVAIKILINKLDSRKYDILSLSDNQIVFCDEFPLVRMRHEPSQFDEGTIDLQPLGNRTLVKLTYSISYKLILIIPFFVIVMAIIYDWSILIGIPVLFSFGYMGHSAMRNDAEYIMECCKQ